MLLLNSNCSNVPINISLAHFVKTSPKHLASVQNRGPLEPNVIADATSRLTYKADAFLTSRVSELSELTTKTSQQKLLATKRVEAGQAVRH